MPKVDKSNYTKEQWKQVRDSRRQSKRERLIEEHTVSINELLKQANQGKMCFVLGNGTSRKSIDLPKLAMCGKIYACNAVYRTFAPDYLVAVDVTSNVGHRGAHLPSCGASAVSLELFDVRSHHSARSAHAIRYLIDSITL
mgnify:CR=1 FL=1